MTRLPQGKHGIDKEGAEDNLPNSFNLNVLMVFVLRINEAKGDWKGNNAECSAEEDDGVADIVEIEILYGLGAQNDEQDHKDSTVKAVIQIAKGGCLDLDKADRGQGRSEDDEQGHGGGDGGVLDPEDVSPEQTLQLTVLEPVPVEQPGEGNLPVAVHGLHAVVHDADRDGAALLPGDSESQFTFSVSFISLIVLCRQDLLIHHHDNP